MSAADSPLAGAAAQAPRTELDLAWRQFGSAASAEDFCRHWLALQCHATHRWQTVAGAEGALFDEFLDLTREFEVERSAFGLGDGLDHGGERCVLTESRRSAANGAGLAAGFWHQHSFRAARL